MATLASWNTCLVRKKIFLICAEQLNLVFSIIFTLEAAFKLAALGRTYFEDGWNIFDIAVVIGTWIAFTLQTIFGLNIGSQTTVIRTFRICRVFRLVKKAKSLNTIFSAFIVTIPSLANIGGLLILLIYLYAILGVFLFAPVRLQNTLNVHANFQGFGSAFLTLIRMATGEAWNELLFDSSRRQSIVFDCLDNPTYADYVSNQCKSKRVGILE